MGGETGDPIPSKRLKRRRGVSGEGSTSNRAKVVLPPRNVYNSFPTSETIFIPQGQFGFRRAEGLEDGELRATLRVFPENHISTTRRLTFIEGCGMAELIRDWYTELPTNVRSKVEHIGFKPLIDGLSSSKADSALLLSMAEKWWDTTHTFHFENVGEMTMTPKDFSCIAGIAVTGIPLKLDKFSHKKKQVIMKYFGEPLTTQCGSSVGVKWIWQSYHNIQCTTPDEEDQLVRVFILALLGSTLFARPNNRVDLYFLPSIKDIDKIGTFNWGAAGLAYLYQQMDDLCRANNSMIGGLWKSWEVWAREYLPAITLLDTKKMKDIFPRLLRWNECDGSEMEPSFVVDYYRIKLSELVDGQVNWDPWGDDAILPDYVKSSVKASQKRILLFGPNGGEWYLGERVCRQSVGEPAFLIPKHPPRSMLVTDKCNIITKTWALEGKCCYEFINDKSSMSYAEFTRRCLSSQQVQTNQQSKGTEDASISDTAPTCGCCEDIFPMPPWTLLLPNTVGGPNIIRIPTDIGIDNLQIPPHIKQVHIRTVKRLLRMIAGMQHVLIEYVTNARETLNDYAAIIQNLRQELNERPPAADADDVTAVEHVEEVGEETHPGANQHVGDRRRDDGDVEDFV